MQQTQLQAGVLAPSLGLYSLLLVLGLTLTLYSTYWAFIILTGARSALKQEKGFQYPSLDENLPYISILVAVKNEEKLVDRLIASLTSLRYPRNKYEVVFAEDGSTDNTLRKLIEHQSKDGLVKVYHFERAGSKAAALNKALKKCRGEVVYLIDADCIPEKDILLKIAGLFSRGAEVATGYYKIINPSESVISRMTMFEEFLWRLMSLGREKLGLSCPASGYNYAIKKKLLEELGGFREDVLAEDAELTVRLATKGVKLGFYNGYVWVSVPSKLGLLLKQRIRWYRGYVDALWKNIKGLTKGLNVLTLDILLLFSSPIFAALGFLNTILVAHSLLITQAISFLHIMASLSLALTLLSVFGLGLALRKAGGDYVSLAKLSPLVLVYGAILMIASIVAVIKQLIKSPRAWEKFEHSNHIDVNRINTNDIGMSRESI